MSKVEMARALAGEGASDEDVVRQIYRLERNEFAMFYGPDKPFPDFWEWAEQKIKEMDAQ